MTRTLPVVLLAATLSFGCKSREPRGAIQHRHRAGEAVIENASMKVVFRLGDAHVYANVFQMRHATPTMVNVHDDENTSVEAGKTNIERYGGRLIELSHGGDRLIRFSLNGEKFAFDPNRIFSELGIAETLKQQSRYSETARAAIKDFATKYLQKFALDKEPVIIALHNTVDGIFSVQSFTPGGEYASSIASAYVSPNHSRFDFCYVTDRRFFDYLKNRDFNVVLQDNERVTDDGSLSVYFARKGIPYINVEAEVGHLPEQIEMLKAVREMLNEFGLQLFH